MSINPDAHSTRELDPTHRGVEMARKGGVPKDRVLNCLRKDELASYLEKMRARRRPKRVSAGIEKRAAPRKKQKNGRPQGVSGRAACRSRN